MPQNVYIKEENVLSYGGCERYLESKLGFTHNHRVPLENDVRLLIELTDLPYDGFASDLSEAFISFWDKLLTYQEGVRNSTFLFKPDAQIPTGYQVGEHHYNLEGKLGIENTYRYTIHRTFIHDDLTYHEKTYSDYLKPDVVYSQTYASYDEYRTSNLASKFPTLIYSQLGLVEGNTATYRQTLKPVMSGGYTQGTAPKFKELRELLHQSDPYWFFIATLLLNERVYISVSDLYLLLKTDLSLETKSSVYINLLTSINGMNRRKLSKVGYFKPFDSNLLEELLLNFRVQYKHSNTHYTSLAKVLNVKVHYGVIYHAVSTFDVTSTYSQLKESLRDKILNQPFKSLQLGYGDTLPINHDLPVPLAVRYYSELPANPRAAIKEELDYLQRNI